MKNNNKVVRRKFSKKSLLSVNMAYIHISAGFGNIHVAATSDGKVISKSSAGANGLKGSKKSTPYAGQLTMSAMLKDLFEKAPNVSTVKVITRGPGASKEAAIRAISSYISRVIHIQDVTPVPHNGCTPKKPRSV